jgi:hypothetical protein
VRGLARAALVLDADATTRILRDGISQQGVVPAWDGLMRPVLEAVGSRWAVTGEGVEVEHLLTECAVGVFREVSGASSETPAAPSRGRTVLLACTADDLHSLPLHALAAALAEHAVRARVLGAALPPVALRAAVRRVGPAAVFLWAQFPAGADVAGLDRLPRTRPPTALLVGGPGWQEVPLEGRATLARDLADAVRLVRQAVGA